MTCPDIKKIGLPNASGAFVKADIGMLGDKSSRTGQKLRRFGRVFHATRIAIQMFNSGKVVVEVFLSNQPLLLAGRVDVYIIINKTVY